MSFRFHVSGVVREQGSGRPLLDLVVRAYDADVVADDFLGETRTDADGRFDLVFTQVAFRDVQETHPDLYLVILDATGERVLHSTRSELRKNAGVEERYVIEIPTATRLAPRSVRHDARPRRARDGAELAGARLRAPEHRRQLEAFEQAPQRDADRGDREALRRAGVAAMAEGRDELARRQRDRLREAAALVVIGVEARELRRGARVGDREHRRDQHAGRELVAARAVVEGERLAAPGAA